MLSKIDIAALRKADSILFRSEKDGTHTISAIKKADQPSEKNPFPQESRRDIKVSASLRDYSKGSFGSDWRVESYEAFHMTHSAQYCDEWETFASLLRDNDEIILAWTYENTSPAMQEAGVSRDELRLVIKRGEKRMSFLNDSRVYVNAGKHRMIKVTHKQEEASAA